MEPEIEEDEDQLADADFDPVFCICDGVQFCFRCGGEGWR